MHTAESYALVEAFRGSTRNPEHLAFLAEPVVRRLMARAWDEGFMDAAGQDHPAYPRTRRIDNPYERPIPPGSIEGPR